VKYLKPDKLVTTDRVTQIAVSLTEFLSWSTLWPAGGVLRIEVPLWSAGGVPQVEVPIWFAAEFLTLKYPLIHSFPSEDRKLSNIYCNLFT
jgi:hypothetical protein